MKRLWFVIAIAGVVWGAGEGRAGAAKGRVVAVFDIDGVKAGLGASTTDKLTTLLGTELAASGVYTVVPREQVRKRLTGLRKKSYKMRFDRSKQIEIGKELAAQKSLATRVMRIGRKCVITSTLWDIRTSSSERAAVVRSRCSAGALVDSFQVVAAKLTASMDRVIHDLDLRLTKVTHSGSYRRWESRYKPGDRTASPYFYIPGGKPGEGLPLKSTRAEVNIVGVIAQVKVEQTYQNRGKKPIEAIYVFPGSTRAAIHGMQMRIGERIIEAEIKSKRMARRVYERAKRSGKRASLLEQKRSSVFMMSVANIMPGEEIGIEMVYSELLVPAGGVYELVYPTVVGPRYGDARAAGNNWAANPHLAAGQKEPYTFGFTAHLQSAIGIKELTSPSHKIKVNYHSATSATVKLAQKGGGNKDVVLRYRLAGNKIESGILVFEDKDEKFFLAMLEPPRRVRRADVTPREYIFVVDVSGSMGGFPLRTSKELIKNLFKDLRTTDYFNVVLFASSSRVLSPRSLRASASSLERAFNLLDNQRGGGGTELLAALRSAYKIPKPIGRGLSRTVVVITDGFIMAESPVYRFVRKNLRAANLFAFGIGTSVNRGLIELLADAGMGRPFVVLDRHEASSVASKFRKYIDAPVLTDIRVGFKGLDTYDVVPREVPDLLAERPLIVFGKYHGRTAGRITIDGYSGSGRYRRAMAINPKLHSTRNWPLRVLWARKWVDLLMQQQRLMPGDEPLKRAVTDVGLIYKIVTPFTSFVAVDQEKVNPGGPQQQARQPLPTPGKTAPPSPVRTGRTKRVYDYANDSVEADRLAPLAAAGPSRAAARPQEEREGDEAAPPPSDPGQKLAVHSKRGCGCATTAPEPDLSVFLLTCLLGLHLLRRRPRPPVAPR